VKISNNKCGRRYILSACESISCCCAFTITRNLSRRNLDRFCHQCRWTRRIPGILSTSQTDFQTRAASMALADYLDSLAEPDLMAILKSIENILRNYLQSDRIVIPALETVAGLFEENIFSRLEGNYKFVPADSSLMVVFGQYSFLRRKWGLNQVMS
jgi:hypothetical protein